MCQSTNSQENDNVVHVHASMNKSHTINDILAEWYFKVPLRPEHLFLLTRLLVWHVRHAWEPMIISILNDRPDNFSDDPFYPTLCMRLLITLRSAFIYCKHDDHTLNSAVWTPWCFNLSAYQIWFFADPLSCGYQAIFHYPMLVSYYIGRLHPVFCNAVMITVIP